MIGQRHESLLQPGYSDLDKLQQRANRQRSRRNQSHALRQRYQQAQAHLSSPFKSISRLPTRFALHLIVALTLPLALVLSQVQPGVLLPTQQSAPASGDGDFVAPIAPLSLDAQTTIGDAPLEETSDLPVPLSLVSRTEALAPVIVQGSIAGDRIMLRSGPGTNYDAVERMSADTSVQVIGRFGDWYQVRESVGQPVYWAPGERLNLPEDATFTLFEVQESVIPAPPPPKIGTVNESGLQLRDGPGTNYIPMTKFNAGTELELIETYQDWYHVGIPDGASGWVKQDYVSVEAPVVNRLLEAETIPDANPQLSGVINENSVNLRQGPDSKYTKVGSVDSGTQYDLIGKHNDWYKIQLSGGDTAWVFSDLINVTPHVSRRVPATSDFPALPRPQQIVNSGGGGNAPVASAPAAPTFADIPASGDVASFGLQFVGSPYVWGGAGPGGFDCSGFTQYVYSQYGVSLPHNAAAQFSTRYGASVGSMGNLAPGDLVFFVGTTGQAGITHVALYVGGGRIVHAMTPRYGVQVSSLGEQYWQSHYYGAIRVQR
ncbi:MAG: SH3 domain-containing protein [Chloroflexota bacterium]